MVNIIMIILITASAVTVTRIIKQVLAQRPHLTEEEIQAFVDLKMDISSNEYTRFIGHLSGCESCQAELNAAQDDSNKIEKHLV